MKRILCVLLATLLTALVFVSCKADEYGRKEKFTESFIDYFDTVTTVTGFEENVEAFDSVSEKIENLLEYYHRLYDIYNAYSGINNIKTVNDSAGIAPVTVDKSIIDLLDFSKEMYTLSGGKTDITMGAVLSLWHDAREKGIKSPENAALPDGESLSAARDKCGFDKIVIDRENSTVFITEKGISLDVGAVAKGYATEQIALTLEGMGIMGYALNVGGNIRVLGTKPNGDKWTAAVRDPDGEGYLINLNLDNKSFVTSGSYQRFFSVAGKRYHHIINPETLFPSEEFSSVSVLCDDSGKADSLSTALFSMSLEDGKRLIEGLTDTEAVWVKADGEMVYSSGFSKSVYS